MKTMTFQIPQKVQAPGNHLERVLIDGKDSIPITSVLLWGKDL